MAQTPERFILESGRPYYEIPGYIPDSPPRFGVDFFAVTDNVGVVLHRKTMVIYYFYSQYDVPAPLDDWRWMGRYFVLGSKDPNLIDPWIMREVIQPVLKLPLSIGDWATDWLPVDVPDSISAAVGFLAMVLSVSVIGTASTISALASVVSYIDDKIGAVIDATEGIRRTIGETIAAARSIYGKVAEFVHLDELLIIEKVLDLTWTEYQNKKTELLVWVGALSESLFNDVHVINQWLNLAGMVWKDWALISGYTWVEQDMEWLIKSAKFMDGIEGDLETYARHPEQLWVDMEIALVKPIYEARAADLSTVEKGRIRISEGLSYLERSYGAIDKRLREYQIALPDNVSTELGEGLRNLRRDLRDLWSNDLKGVFDGIEYAVGLSRERIQSVTDAHRKTALAVTETTRLLSNPKDLDASGVRHQRVVFSRITNSLADRLNAFSEAVNIGIESKWGETYEKIRKGE